MPRVAKFSDLQEFFVYFSSKLERGTNFTGVSVPRIQMNGLEIFKFYRAALKIFLVLNLLFILRHSVLP